MSEMVSSETLEPARNPYTGPKPRLRSEKGSKGVVDCGIISKTGSSSDHRREAPDQAVFSPPTNHDKVPIEINGRLCW